MLAIKFLMAICSLYLWGYITLKLVNFKSHNFFESAALSFGLGSGFVGLSIFFLALSGIPLTQATVILPQAILFIIYVVIRKPKIALLRCISKRPFLKRSFAAWELILLCFISFEIAYVLFEAASGPFVAWDAWCNWGFKAKMLFLDKTFSLREWLDSPNIPHLNYAPFLPFLETYIYIILGEIYEPAARVFCSLYFINLVSLLYGTLRRQSSKRFSLLFCFLLSTTPILLQESVSGYADVPLAFYVALAVFNLWRYLNAGEQIRLWLGGLFCGLAMWTKNEGISIWLAMILSLTLAFFLSPKLYAQKKKILLSQIFLPWGVFSPWLILRLIFGIKNEAPFKPVAVLSRQIAQWLLPMLKVIFWELTKIGRWNISWFIFLILAVWSIRLRRKELLFLAFVVSFESLFFTLVFIFTASSLEEMLLYCGQSLHRPLLQLYPIALFFIAQYMSKYAEV